MKACLALLFSFSLFAQAPANASDPLGRVSPRSTVSGFLEACNGRDFNRAAQYLDLRAIPEHERAAQGVVLAKELEGILNADSHFSVLAVSRNPEGDLGDDSDPNRDHVASVSEGKKLVTLDVSRVALTAGAAPVWVFSSDTVLEVPRLAKSSAQPELIARYLPPVLSAAQILETPLWKWIALILGTLLLISLSRLLDRILVTVIRVVASRFSAGDYIPWVQALIAPLRVLLCLLLFRLGLELLNPSAITRLYVGRFAQIVFVWSVAWCLMRVASLSLERVEMRMDEPRRFASRSILHLGRRTFNTVIIILGILTVLSNWGYNTATLVAGLGVGGIAIALAAQQTIANIFGGVSVIADHPIRIGEYGKFGDLFGTLEDIGLRSTSVRTLNRTVVSIPNSTFAGYNLENYGSRDKILFNPTFQVKRATPEDRLHSLVDTLSHSLAANKDLELVPTPVRITGLGAAAINIEIFCYVLTADIDRFYVIQGDLLLVVNRALQTAEIELA